MLMQNTQQKLNKGKTRCLTRINWSCRQIWFKDRVVSQTRLKKTPLNKALEILRLELSGRIEETRSYFLMFGLNFGSTHKRIKS